MTAAIIAGVAAFVIVGIILARQTSSRKQEAVQSLAEEKKTIGAYSITEMADEEIRDLGLRDIEGGSDLASDVVLKVWKDSEHVWRDCDRADLRYVVADGIDPAQAVVTDVHLECAGSSPAAEHSDDEPRDDEAK